MKIIVDIPDEVLKESIQTAHNLNVKFDVYATDAFNDYNEKWEKREKMAEEDWEGAKEWGEVKGSNSFADIVEVGDLITRVDEKPVYIVEEIIPLHGNITGVKVKGKDGKVKTIQKEDFHHYTVLPF